MTTKNNKRSVRRQRTLIHPSLPVPDGMDEVGLDPETLAKLAEQVLDQTDYLEYQDYQDSTVTNEPDSPISIKVLSQELRTKKNGEQVVDVVFQVKGIEGALNYELRHARLGPAEE